MFILTYFGYCNIHFQREGWSMSKFYILQDEVLKETLDFKMLSRLDSLQLLCYAIAMYAGGFIADRYNKRILISISYLGFATSTFL